MKIVYVVPGPMVEQEVLRRGALLQEWAAPGVVTEIASVSSGPASIESMYEEYLSIPETAKLIFQLEYIEINCGCQLFLFQLLNLPGV